MYSTGREGGGGGGEETGWKKVCMNVWGEGGGKKATVRGEESRTSVHQAGPHEEWPPDTHNPRLV